MSETITRPTTFVIEDCCDCFMPFALTEEFKKRRIKDKAWFYCPNGHPQHYVGKTDEQLLYEEKQRTASALEDARIARAEAQRLEEQLHMSRREGQRQAQRSKGGACPCCNRTFVQLARHMKTQHPDHGGSK